MQQNNGPYYIYRHIRLDTGVPFYVGIGTKRRNVKKFTSYKDEFSRAYRVSRKKEYWDNIVNKTDYEVEILMQSDNYEFIKQKEIEFIALHGRRVTNTGTLVNLTEGGEGNKGYTYTEEQINRMQKSWKRKKDKDSTCSKKCYQYSKEGVFIKEWDCITTAALHCNMTPTNIVYAMKSVYHYAKGYQWYYEYNGKSVHPFISREKTVIQKDPITGDIIQLYSSVTNAAKILTGKVTAKGSIASAARNGKHLAVGYKWEYNTK